MCTSFSPPVQTPLDLASGIASPHTVLSGERQQKPAHE
eukprot:CAMPEP_0182930826 /NCGR_PEP_ID=MMETSP0105_2-20130417/26431_1 /TAXON_ID=81532 ORGANISM="Acanthoeca-like sp., Strain 10tr" /NCGR_SAMPLE_ID=MMETSP0105_2 /ASSEMBLY_ACC=CAM_ASM_000205 /LENGTH=37 /DNA_ID= /DNA_START= /DNA_END= /DNA_ORIENTATION=